MKEGFYMLMFSHSLVSFCLTVVLFFAIFPSMIYGGFIGARIAKQEKCRNVFRKVFLIVLFAVIGAILFPLTVTLMIYYWEQIENDIDRVLRRMIRFFRRLVR